MSTDIQRLHDVALGIRTGRGAGHTTLDCHSVAGELELGAKLIVITLPSKSHFRHVVPMLKNILEEHGFVIVTNASSDDRIFLTCQARIFIETISEWERKGAESSAVVIHFS